MHPTQNITNQTTQSDEGYTLIELLLVVLILGILASIVIFAVGGVRADASESGCGTDARVLATATESYFALYHTDQLPSSGTSEDRFEQLLVDSGLLRATSEYYNLDTDGELTAEAGSSC